MRFFRLAVPRVRFRRLAAATLTATAGMLAGSVLAVPPTPASAESLAPSGWTTIAGESATVVNAVNAARAAAGLPPLQVDWSMSVFAQEHSIAMAGAAALYHTPNLAAAATAVAPGWTQFGENVGEGPTVPSVDDAFMASPEHRANILGSYDLLGVGVVNTVDGTAWITEEFAQAPAP